MVAPILTTLRSNNMYNSATKELGGSNIPHVLLVSNKNEFWDQAINQFGNTAVVFGGGYLFHRLIDRIFTAVHKGEFVENAFKNAAKQKWYVFGKSLAIYSFIAGYVLASPFLRNWVTSRNTKTNNYAEMVGLVHNDNLGAHEHPPEDPILQARRTAERKVKERKYMRQFLVTMGAAIAATVGALGLTHRMALKAAPLGKPLESFNKYVGLPNADFRRLKDLPTYLFWALPCYAGLYAGSRDKLEKKEILFRAGGFGLAFILLPRTLERYVNKAIKGKHFKVFGPGENIGFLAQLLSGIIFYTSIPTLSNLIKRRQRAHEYGLISDKDAKSNKPILFFMKPH